MDSVVLGAQTPVGIGWQLNGVSGWGVFGTHLALELVRSGRYMPTPLVAPIWNTLNPLHQALLTPAATQHRRVKELVDANPGQSLECNFTILKELGNNFATGAEPPIRGKRNVGVIFFEDTDFTPSGIEAGRRYEAIVAGSSWNAEVLRARGFQNVITAPQGVDPTIFHPAPRSQLLSRRFMVFSGGKLEYRKGQDLTIAAFRIFHARHPDAALMFAWHNHWPTSMAGLDHAGHVRGTPGVENGLLKVGSWLVDNDVPAGSFLDLGMISNALAGQLVREADVAIFPNRCEGGTNLVAMEAMASGVPTILSANTGHLDLVASDACYVGQRQQPILAAPTARGSEGWGESDVDELVDLLETVYANREAAAERGRRAAEWMHNWSWQKQMTRLIEQIESLIAPT